MIERMMRWFLLLLALLLASPPLLEAQPVLVSADMRQALDLDGPGTGRSIRIATGSPASTAARLAPATAATTTSTPPRPCARTRRRCTNMTWTARPWSSCRNPWSPTRPTCAGTTGWSGISAISPRIPSAGSALSCASARSIIAPMSTSTASRRRHEGGFTPFAFEVTQAAARRRQPDHRRRRFRAHAGRRAAGGHRLGELWRHHPAGSAGHHARDLCRRCLGAADARRPDRGRRVRLDGPDAAGREVRVRIPALGFALAGRTGGATAAGPATAPAPRGLQPLVAGEPEALRRARSRPARTCWRDRDRLPHDRGARRGHPAQRQADLPARHLHPRGGIGREPDARRSRPAAARALLERGQGRASTPISSASPIIRIPRR